MKSNEKEGDENEERKTISKGEGRGRRGAITIQDAMYSRTSSFRYAISKAEDIISEALAISRPWSVSFSGGKDSTCALALIRSQSPEIKAVFVNSGAEYPETLVFVSRTKDVIIVEPTMSIIDMYKEVGLYGSAAVQPGKYWANGQIKETMIGEPMRLTNSEHGFVGNFTGLRSEESARRKKMARFSKKIWTQADGTLRCEPIMDWKTCDVWAFIADRELEYNQVYDRLSEIGIPREQWRVAPYAGSSVLGWGRWAILKLGWPELFNLFATEFPEARCYV